MVEPTGASLPRRVLTNCMEMLSALQVPEIALQTYQKAEWQDQFEETSRTVQMS